MVVKLLEKHLQDLGYIGFKTTHPQIIEYCKEEGNCINILQITDVRGNGEISREQFLGLKDKVRNAPGKDIHIMNLVFFESYEQALSIVSDEYMCWLIDKKQLVIHPEEDRIEDFYGLKNELEKWLEDTKILIDSGDMEAISNRLLNQQERDTREKQKKKKPAPVSVVLVIVNCIIFSTYLIVGDAFIEAGQMNSVLVSQEGQIYRFLTAMFLHGGIEHLLSNMLLLYVLGEIVENKLGSVRYAIVYFLSGILGNVVSFSYVILSNRAYCSVGASGAVYGIIGAMLFLVLKKTEGLNIPIKRMLFMVAYCIYSSFATAHVDYAAHIGGLVAGLIITALICPRGGRARNEG